MGLYCEFSIVDDLGYPADLSGGDEKIGEASVFVNYSAAVEAFITTFLEVANELVPVDTGFLQSTIDAGGGSDWCWCEATADYAQYVEYGTISMDAQPYFEPALMAGIEALGGEAEIAISEAQDELEAILSSLMEASMAMAGSSGGMGGMFSMGWGQFFMGLAIFAAITIILFPILVNVYAIIDSLSYKSDSGGGGGGGLPEVIIT